MTKNEGKRLQEEKNALLQEMLLSLEKQKEAFRQGKMDLFSQLLAETDRLMEQVDRLEERRRAFPHGGEEKGQAWHEEQQELLAAIQELHRELILELLRQRSEIAEKLAALQQSRRSLGAYQAAAIVPEGVFLDQKK
ncbi:MAG: flagellar protein FliT [Clostridia bacterium]|jgi:hypothetical protein|nr:flagellar protein FliT [Clostridia bacterium]